MTQAIYKFGKGIDTGMFDSTIVGGKGAKLAEMGAGGLNVPPGITITTKICNDYLNDVVNVDMLTEQVLVSYEDIIKANDYMPLVSVRSGARVSMPGMMDTILNVGINSDNLSEWEDHLGSHEAAADCYERLIKMYSEVVVGIPVLAFDLADTYAGMLTIYEELTGTEFPQSIEEQLAGCIAAVFNSWNSERAVAYRATYGYPDDWGTAVNVQQMVFGNRNDKSASGVMFTRDFNTGEQGVVGDWLPNAQGEDVVAGTHDTKPISLLGSWQDYLPMEDKVYYELLRVAASLEDKYNDMQDIEFTIDNGELFILQTRDGKRSAKAAFKIAYELYKEDRLTKEEALARVTGKQYIALQNPMIDPAFKDKACVTGIGAAGRIVSGIAVMSAADAVSCTEDCILVTEETTPKDFKGMAASVGILTKTGGITSHAAVVARGMDKVCVVGAEKLEFEGLAGKHITINGETGEVWVDKSVPVLAGQIPEFVEEMIEWADTDDDRFLSVRPESVPEAQTVYVDVSGTLSTLTAFTVALKSIKKSGSDGIIGFGCNNLVEGVDSEFMNFFGVSAQTYDDGTYAVMEKVLIQSKWTKTFKKRWTLHLPHGIDTVLVEVIKAHGWKCVTFVNSFKTAITIDGYIVMDEGFIKQLKKEGMTFGDIADLVIKAGGNVKELPDRVTKERRLFDVLGG